MYINNKLLNIKIKKFFILQIFLVFIFLCLFYLYLKILYPAFALNDSPETITAIYTLGIPHPPGYPLFNMLGKIFLSSKIGAPAFNANLFTAFLSIINLLLLFFLIKKIYEKETIAFLCVLIFAFAYGFLKEAIQAKGGIYVLNLIFISLILLVIFSLFKNYSIKKIYFLFFIYFLSLSNHWQTMIFFIPLIIYILIYNFKELKFKNYLFILVFILTGISPYLYLLIRASNGAVLNNGNPYDLLNLLKHVFRINYTGEFENLNFNILVFQINEFLRVVIMSYYFIVILILIGLYYSFKRKEKISIILFLFFIINILSVIIFFRRKQDSSCYYLPAVFISVFFMAEFLKKLYLFKNKIIKVFSFAAILFISSININYNYKLLNNSKNYLSYDYINNIYKTIEKNAIYIASSDFDINPVFYMKYVLNKRNDINFIFLNFLAFDWGIELFKSDFKDFKVDLEIKKPKKNIVKIIKYYFDKKSIYAGYNYETVKKTGILHKQKGLLLVTGKIFKKVPDLDYFKIYSYRGIFNKNYYKIGDSFRLISNYAGNMVNYGSEYLKNKKIDKAIELYKIAIKFPFNGSKKGFYYNLSIAFKIKGDIKMAEEYFKIAENIDNVKSSMKKKEGRD